MSVDQKISFIFEPTKFICICFWRLRIIRLGVNKVFGIILPYASNDVNVYPSPPSFVPPLSKINSNHFGSINSNICNSFMGRLQYAKPGSGSPATPPFLFQSPPHCLDRLTWPEILSSDLDKNDQEGHKPHHHSAHTAGSHSAYATLEGGGECARRRPLARGEHTGRESCSTRRAVRNRRRGDGGDGRCRSRAAGRKNYAR